MTLVATLPTSRAALPPQPSSPSAFGRYVKGDAARDPSHWGWLLVALGSARGSRVQVAMGVLHPPRAAGSVGDVAQQHLGKVPGGGQPSPHPAQRGRGATAATSPPAPGAKGLGAKMRNPRVQLWFIPSLPRWGCHTIPFAPALWEGEHCPAARRHLQRKSCDG